MNVKRGWRKYIRRIKAYKRREKVINKRFRKTAAYNKLKGNINHPDFAKII